MTWNKLAMFLGCILVGGVCVLVSGEGWSADYCDDLGDDFDEFEQSQNPYCCDYSKTCDSSICGSFGKCQDHCTCGICARNRIDGICKMFADCERSTSCTCHQGYAGQYCKEKVTWEEKKNQVYQPQASEYNSDVVIETTTTYTSLDDAKKHAEENKYNQFIWCNGDGAKKISSDWNNPNGKSQTFAANEARFWKNTHGWWGAPLDGCSFYSATYTGASKRDSNADLVKELDGLMKLADDMEAATVEK